MIQTLGINVRKVVGISVQQAQPAVDNMAARWGSTIAVCDDGAVFELPEAGGTFLGRTWRELAAVPGTERAHNQKENVS